LTEHVANFSLQWEFVDPDPNVVTIKQANTTSAKEIDGRIKHITNYQANAQYTVPALLHTCYTSRKIALETYHPRFEAHLGHPIYFDFNKDILKMEGCEALASFLRVPWFANLEINFEHANQIRFLAISGESISYQDRILQRLHRFEGLDDLYFERQSSEKATLMTHFEWGLRMKWQTWKTWKTGVCGDRDIPKITFLEQEEFCELVNG
jgi:hypothetical protein